MLFSYLQNFCTFVEYKMSYIRFLCQPRVYNIFSLNTVPGKPPTNMSVEATNPTSLLIKWKFPLPSYEPAIPNKALRIFYKLQGNTTVQTIKDTNVTVGFHALDKLKKFSWYTVWVKSVTSRGLGVESERFTIRTLEEGMLAAAVLYFVFFHRLNHFFVDDTMVVVLKEFLNTAEQFIVIFLFLTYQVTIARNM